MITICYKETHYPHVSFEKDEQHQFLCTFKLDGEIGVVYHDIWPDGSKVPVQEYLSGLDGVLTDVWYWQLI